MTLPQFPPAIEMSNETKRAVINGLKKVIELFQAAGRLNADLTYSDIIHEPRDLYRFIKTYRNSTNLVGEIVTDTEGKPVTAEDVPLVCGVTLAQVQQLLVRTCSRHFLELANKEEPKIVTETVKKKVLGIFTKTVTVEKMTGGGYDERKVREISRNMAFDWQLPLLPAYNILNSAQLFELGDDLPCLQSFEAIRDFASLDQATIKKAKTVAGEEFGYILTMNPAALPGVGTWSRDMYVFYRRALGDAAFEFFARDKDFFMVCADLDKPLIEIYGEVLATIDGANLQELQRLNIDKTDVLLQAMRSAFGANFKEALANPHFAKDILRKLVESLQHVTQEKVQLAQSALITCKAEAPQVAAWVERQRAAAARA
jgi:hypothetical protein